MGLLFQLSLVNDYKSTSYFYDRLRGYAADQSFKPDVFEAVLAVKPTKPVDFMQRLKAVSAFRALEQAEALAAGNKRIGNILRKNNAEDDVNAIDERLLQEPAEKALASKLTEITAVVQPLIAVADYTAVLTNLAAMRETVDGFFDEVMVNTSEAPLRLNRRALMKAINELYTTKVADLSQVVLETREASAVTTARAGGTKKRSHGA